MFELLKAARTQGLYLTNNMSEAAMQEHQTAQNGDMIDFCTTTYSSIRNREYCIEKFVKPRFNFMKY
eukprot:CAMPEP_0173439926 /NCGR_PEP_ID=MMETSP1357-20121228/21878_1 /TAXON_ID=77926 /ORGANISM="Hemiselmis rufescens, Strain PCC563" /LENGTH=66 /DNA_ID=CAMNT_0014405341 /DNA_START=29 /DNA_END=229 /DNA_ORIENTATION=+